MTNKLNAVAAGHLCLDIYPDLTGSTSEQFSKAFAPGHLLGVGPISFSTGGPVSNTGLALHKLGIATRLMGKIGDDVIGNIIQRIIEGYNPDLATGMIVVPRENSSYTIVISPPNIDRILLHCPGANDTFTADDVRYDLLNEASLFHFGYPPLMRRMFEPDGSQLATILQRVKAAGLTTSLDTAFPDPASRAGRADWRAVLGAALPYVDIFMPSIEELLIMLRQPLYETLRQRATNNDVLPLISPEILSDLSHELLSMGARIVGLKLGSRGLYLRTANQESLACMGRGQPSDLRAWSNREIWSPCFKVDVVGTTGSGDSTIAGFLSAFLRDFSPEQAMNAAVAVGACNVEAADSLSGLQPWEQTMQRMASGWEKHPFVITVSTWSYDSDARLWNGPAV